LADHIRDSCVLHEGAMLDDAALDERTGGARRSCEALRRGMAPILEQPGGVPEKRAPVMMRLRQHVERIPPQLLEFAREAVRNDGFALDQASVAIRGFL